MAPIPTFPQFPWPPESHWPISNTRVCPVCDARPCVAKKSGEGAGMGAPEQQRRLAFAFPGADGMGARTTRAVRPRVAKASAALDHSLLGGHWAVNGYWTRGAN